MLNSLFGSNDVGFAGGHTRPSFRFDAARPTPRASPKAARPAAVCSRCAAFSYFASDAGTRCDRAHRGTACSGVMRAAAQRDDWRSCDWCTASGWHRGMCCARCQGAGWVAKRAAEHRGAILHS